MSEAYKGVKFSTEMASNQVPHDPRLKELGEWCRKFHECNLAPPYEGGSYGNLSFRVKPDEDAFIITASSSGLNESTTDDRFVTVSSVDLEKGVVYAHGTRKPSSESMLHYAIYKQRKDVNAIFHGHSQEMLCNVKKAGIIETAREEPYGTMELVQRVLDVLGNNMFLMMKNHGFISLGRTMDEAGDLTLEMQKRCL